MQGYVRYANRYYLFQPNAYADLTIPLAVRAAKFPVKRDAYLPMNYKDEDWVEEEKYDVPVVTVEVEPLWKAILLWTDQLATRRDYTNPPVELNQRRVDVSQQDKERLDQFLMIFEMIAWFHHAYHASHQQSPEAFRTALLQYFWDEWMTLEEQRQLVTRVPSREVLLCVQENQYQFGKTLVNRYLDAKTGTIQYDCENGEACLPSYVDEIAEDKEEPMRTFAVLGIEPSISSL